MKITHRNELIILSQIRNSIKWRERHTMKRIINDQHYMVTDKVTTCGDVVHFSEITRCIKLLDDPTEFRHVHDETDLSAKTGFN